MIVQQVVAQFPGGLRGIFFVLPSVSLPEAAYTG